MTTLEKYKLIVNLIGKTCDDYKNITFEHYNFLSGFGKKDVIDERFLTKNRLMLANLIWQDFVFLYKNNNLESIYHHKNILNGNNITQDMIDEINDIINKAKKTIELLLKAK